MTKSLEDANSAWQEVCAASIARDKALWQFLHNCERNARIAVLKSQCSVPASEGLCLDIISGLPQDEQLELICPLLQLFVEANIYSYPRPDEIIMALPHELALPRIKECVDSMKRKQDYDEIETLMAFLPRFDQDLALQTAYDLIQCGKQTIRDIGEEYVRESKRES
jgi:hypothetical protein